MVGPAAAPDPVARRGARESATASSRGRPGWRSIVDDRRHSAFDYLVAERRVEVALSSGDHGRSQRPGADQVVEMREVPVAGDTAKDAVA